MGVKLIMKMKANSLLASNATAWRRGARFLWLTSFNPALHGLTSERSWTSRPFPLGDQGAQHQMPRNAATDEIEYALADAYSYGMWRYS